MIQSPLCDTLLLPGNAGTAAIAKMDISITDFEAIKCLFLLKVEMLWWGLKIL
jgi:hypothetical protein